MQTCTERQYPPAEVAQILDSALTSLQPYSQQNLPVYREIETCMGIIKNQMLALLPTPSAVETPIMWTSRSFFVRDCIHIHPSCPYSGGQRWCLIGFPCYLYESCISWFLSPIHWHSVFGLFCVLSWFHLISTLWMHVHKVKVNEE